MNFRIFAAMLLFALATTAPLAAQTVDTVKVRGLKNFFRIALTVRTYLHPTDTNRRSDIVIGSRLATVTDPADSTIRYTFVEDGPGGLMIEAVGFKPATQTEKAIFIISYFRAVVAPEGDKMVWQMQEPIMLPVLPFEKWQTQQKGRGNSINVTLYLNAMLGEPMIAYGIIKGGKFTYAMARRVE